MALIRREEKVTDARLAKLIQEDPVGRNEDLRAFISLLDKVDKGFSFFLDGRWGSGKTVFVKQVVLVLKALHKAYKKTLDQDIIKSIDNGFPNLELKRSYLPIYYNAWENDIYTDSTITLLGALIAESGDVSYGKSSNDVLDKIIPIADAILKPFGLDSITSIKESFRSTNLLASMDAIKKVQSNFEKLVSSMLDKRAERLVLFIDELDRCSPAFALQLIEQIKFVLTMDNVIVVFSTDVSQLAKTVEGYYGAGFNGSHYLTRYYDLKLVLSEVSPSKFLEKQGLGSSRNRFEKIALEIASHCGFQMRDCLRYLEDIEAVRAITAEARSSFNLDTALWFLAEGIAPVMYAIKIDDNDLFQRMLFGFGAKELFELALQSSAFTRFLKHCFQKENEQRQRDKNDQLKDAEDYFKTVYQEAFSRSSGNQNVTRSPRIFFYDSPEFLVIVNKLFGMQR